MTHELWGSPVSFARYKLASVTLIRLRSDLEELHGMPAGESRENAIARNREATRLASAELESSFLAYLPAHHV